ncbi:hypothetical protein IT417_04000 [bacterium]|nr:hypothetical protein [bacterium]
MNVLIGETYAYFYGSLFGILVTALIYVLKPSLRKTILVNGLAVSFMGVILEYFFFQDYWTPPLLFQFGRFGGIADLMFGFAAGAMGATLPELILGIRSKRVLNLRSIIPFYFVALLIQITLIIIAQRLSINSIYASSLGFMLCSLIILIFNRGLIVKQIISGLLGGTILVIGEGIILRAFAAQYLEKYFLLYKDIFVLSNFFIPTEFIWGVCFGMFISTISEFKVEGSI